MTPTENLRMSVMLRKQLREQGYLRCPVCDRITKHGERCGICEVEQAEAKRDEYR